MGYASDANKSFGIFGWIVADDKVVHVLKSQLLNAFWAFGENALKLSSHSDDIAFTSR